MSAKTSKARRNAFLRFLGESGNQTLAAEMAKVSRSWVGLRRSGDAGFDADCRAAIAAAKERLRAAALDDGDEPPHPPPPRGSSSGRIDPSGGRSASGRSREGRGAGASRYFAGEELVVAGTNGVRTQIRRARLKQWTPRVEARFLGALAASCNVKAALAAAGMSKGSAYARRQRLPAFARAWDEAVAIGYVRLEAALVESADHYFDPDGTPTPDEPLHGMSVSLAIHLLHMNKAKLR